ncbi:hypothetical protein BCV72DRAFT_101932 [Rhizopus microsporus var. microsporus]|uniref:Uncharacterized protein n=1 Tax=Rhizopus microsporus var. microsporus TaxID=86635 RepID=A0A1X0QLW9_RHIZD|nr:hypothetical protein BCV72DRAFT_101932 [Rhizopus microsporus var. microsporus]
MLTICIEKALPTSYSSNFKINDEKPFLSKINCEHLAKECYFISSDIISPFIENEETNLDPLVAFGHFFISQQRRLINVER